MYKTVTSRQPSSSALGKRAMGIVDLFGDESDGVPGIVGEEGLRERDGQPGHEPHLKGLFAGQGLD